MKVLAIETSCDETSAAVVEKSDNHNHVQVRSLFTSTSLPEHALIGGIIPERAARMQLEYMLPVVAHALDYGNEDALTTLRDEIDAIAVTQGPGLIGSLLVGVECAKTLSYIFNKPLITVNHLLAHLYSNFISNNSSEIRLPFIGLIVSGGHTDLLLFKKHGDFKWIGGTRDDAVGEALDKIGRKLGLSYPGGPEIEKRALNAKDSSVSFQSPLINSEDFDFSYSGLKTEVARYIDKSKSLNTHEINSICFATQRAAFEVIVKKTVRAAVENSASTILVGGGVAANETLKKMFQKEINESKLDINIFFPEKKYTLDNAAMIGAWATFHTTPTSFTQVKANPEMYFA